MIAEESSTDRSVNNGTICGVVICIIRNAEEADQRQRDRRHRRHTRRTQRLHKIEETLHWISYPAGGAKRAPHPARFAQFMVSVRLIPAGRARKKSAKNAMQMKSSAKRPAFRCEGKTEIYWRYC